MNGVGGKTLFFFFVVDGIKFTRPSFEYLKKKNHLTLLYEKNDRLYLLVEVQRTFKHLKTFIFYEMLTRVSAIP